MTKATFMVGALLLLAPGAWCAQGSTKPAVKTDVQSDTQSGVKSKEKATVEDLRLRAIYNAEDAWRKAQRGAGDEKHPRRVSPELPSADVAKQQADLKHWQGVLRQVDALHPALLSPDERVNYEVFRAQIIVLIDQQKFREYERPANWTPPFGRTKKGLVARRCTLSRTM